MKLRAVRDLLFLQPGAANVIIPQGSALVEIPKSAEEILKQEDPHERHLLLYRLEKKRPDERDSAWFRWEGSIRIGRVGPDVERIGGGSAALPENMAGSNLPRGAPSWAKIKA